MLNRVKGMQNRVKGMKNRVKVGFGSATLPLSFELILLVGSQNFANSERLNCRADYINVKQFFDI